MEVVLSLLSTERSPDDYTLLSVYSSTWNSESLTATSFCTFTITEHFSKQQPKKKSVETIVFYILSSFIIKYLPVSCCDVEILFKCLPLAKTSYTKHLKISSEILLLFLTWHKRQLHKSPTLKHHDNSFREQLRFKWAAGGQLDQPPYSSRAIQSRLPMAVSRQILSISKHEDSTISMSSQWWCLVTLTVKKCFLISRGNLFSFRAIASSPVAKWNLASPHLHNPFNFVQVGMILPQVQPSLIHAKTVPALSVSSHISDAPAF